MPASNKSPLEISDFSGGITDNVFSGEMKRSFQMDNFDILPDNKLLSRAGSVVDDTTNSPVPSGNTRIGALINYARNDKLFVQSAKQFFYRNPAAYSTLQGPSGNDVFSAGNSASAIDHAEWNRELFVTSDSFPHPMKLYKDSGGVYRVRNAGLPQLATPPVITPSVVGVNSYVYAFVHKYSYTVFTQSFIDYGPTYWVTITNSSAPEVAFNQITGIPVLTNTGGNNYDTTNIVIEIYRTLNTRTAFYKVGQVTNGTTTFNDNFSDTTIQNNDLQLYTNDGTLDYYPPPPSKYVHVVGNIGYWGSTSESDGVHPFRIRQAVPGNPNFVPFTTSIELEDELRGLSSLRSIAVALCKKQIYRLDGTFDSAGRGGITPVKIHDSAGCVSHLSAVEAENMLYWAGVDGFYSSDGYTVTKISDHLTTRYKNILSSITATTRIVGRHDLTNRRVYWTVQQDSASGDCDSIFTLDLVSMKMLPEDAKAFATYSGGVNYRPTSIEIFNDYLYRGDTRGFVFKHDPLILTDPKINTAISPTLWKKVTIIWTLVGMQFNFGSSFFRKFVSRVLLQAVNIANTTIQLTATNDQGKSTRDLKLITWRRNFVWGDLLFIWGNNECVWNGEGLIEQWRRFPAKGLRLSYLQMTITNGLGIVEVSDSAGTCTLNTPAKTVVLPGLWPADSVDYFVSFENDSYSRLFQVSAISVDLTTLTLLDPEGFLPPSGTYKWELKGYKKDEPLNLLGYTLHWENVDQNQQTFHSGDSGGNA